MRVIINEWKHHGYLKQRMTEDKYNRIALLFKAVGHIVSSEDVAIFESQLLGIEHIFP